MYRLDPSLEQWKTVKLRSRRHPDQRVYSHKKLPCAPETGDQLFICRLSTAPPPSLAFALLHKAKNVKAHFLFWKMSLTQIIIQHLLEREATCFVARICVLPWKPVLAPVEGPTWFWISCNVATDLPVSFYLSCVCERFSVKKSLSVSAQILLTSSVTWYRRKVRWTLWVIALL